jgi:hypothetical protein
MKGKWTITRDDLNTVLGFAKASEWFQGRQMTGLDETSSSVHVLSHSERLMKAAVVVS